MIDPAFKHALRHLRTVKSERPPEVDSLELSLWRERIAEALEAIASTAPSEKLRSQAKAEAEAARDEAAAARRRHRTEAGEGGGDLACSHPE